MIQEIKEQAIDKLNFTEPNLDEYKERGFKNKEVGLIASSQVEKLISANKQGYYQNHYLGSIECVKLIEIPESYKVALKVFNKNKPKNLKLRKRIQEAYDDAETTIMLGGTDTAMGQAIDKLKELVTKIQ